MLVQITFLRANFQNFDKISSKITPFWIVTRKYDSHILKTLELKSKYRLNISLYPHIERKILQF